MSNPGATPLLCLEKLHKTISPGRCLLDIKKLEILAGKCLLLTGPNGVGKTTLLKIIAGLEPPDSALVIVGDTKQTWSSARKRIMGDVIYLHQQVYLFDCSVTNNIRYGLRHRKLKRLQIEERIAHALEWAGISHLAQRNARQLSGGERQRVALTRALVLQPRVLLLDEPFSGLDEGARSRTAFLIQRIKSEGVAVIVTSHELQPIKGISDRHLELRDGQLVDAQSPADTGHGKIRQRSVFSGANAETRITRIIDEAY